MTREEIIKGLLDIHAVTANYKGDQVILHSMPMPKLTGILYGAETLLTPHVLNLDEIPEHDGAVFIEYKSGDEDWALYVYENGHFFNFNMLTAGVMLPIEDYGVEWRAWTGRPTAEQRWQK